MSERPSFIRTVLGNANVSDVARTGPRFGGHRHDYNTMAQAIRDAQGDLVQAQAEVARREQSLADAQANLAAAQQTVKALSVQFATAVKELAIKPEDLTS